MFDDTTKVELNFKELLILLAAVRGYRLGPDIEQVQVLNERLTAALTSLLIGDPGCFGPSPGYREDFHSDG